MEVVDVDQDIRNLERKLRQAGQDVKVLSQAEYDKLVESAERDKALQAEKERRAKLPWLKSHFCGRGMMSDGRVVNLDDLNADNCQNYDMI